MSKSDQIVRAKDLPVRNQGQLIVFLRRGESLDQAYNPFQYYLPHIGPFKFMPVKCFIPFNPKIVICQQPSLPTGRVTRLHPGEEGKTTKVMKVGVTGKRVPAPKPKKLSATATLHQLKKEAARSKKTASKTPESHSQKIQPLSALLPFSASNRDNSPNTLPFSKRLLQAERLPDLWSSYIESRSMQVSMSNFSEGKRKHCRIDGERGFFVDGEESTWDKARSAAVWKALQTLDGEVCREWLRLHPTAILKYAFLSN